MSALFIAKGMPNLIKSAGDIRALRFLEILKQRYPSISVVASSADYGDGDVRSIGCDPYLNGDFAKIVPELIKEKQPRLIVFSHWTVAHRLMDIVKACSDATIVIDSIDLEFLRLQRKKEYDPNSIDQATIDKVTALELGIYKKADRILVASGTDEAVLEKKGDFKTMLFPCVYDINSTYKPREGKEYYTIGNWTHEPNVVATHYLCEKIMPNVEGRLHIVGKHPPSKLVQYASDKVLIRGAEYEIDKFLDKMNILLAPVMFGAGMNGKIGQALAFGIPVVTTSLGASPYLLKNKHNAMVANGDGSFIDSIRQITEKEHLRDCLSKNGKVVMESLTFDYWKKVITEGIDHRCFEQGYQG